MMPKEGQPKKERIKSKMDKICICTIPFSDCPNAIEAPHGDKWYCMGVRCSEKSYQLAEEIINEMIAAGLDHDSMLQVLKLTKEKLTK